MEGREWGERGGGIAEHRCFNGNEGYRKATGGRGKRGRVEEIGKRLRGMPLSAPTRRDWQRARRRPYTCFPTTIQQLSNNLSNNYPTTYPTTIQQL